MPERSLTIGEKLIVRDIFLESIPVDEQKIDTNDLNLGGRGNSITPFAIPYMSRDRWNLDYSSASWDLRWLFVHEMAHVWQHRWGLNKVINAVVVWVEEGSYEEAYYYSFDSKSHHHSFNFEAQASIIADYYLVKNGQRPKHNKGTGKSLSNYVYFMMPIWRISRHVVYRQQIIRKYGIVRGM